MIKGGKIRTVAVTNQIICELNNNVIKITDNLKSV